MSKIIFREKKYTPMTNGCDMLLSTVILKFRKQMAILTITQRQEMKYIFGQIRLGEVAWSMWFLM